MKMARCLFSLARPIMVVLITTAVVALAVVTTQTQSGGRRSSPSDTRRNGQSQRSEAQRIQRDAVRRLTKLIDEAKQIDDVVDDVTGVGGSDSLVQAIPTQPINNWRVEAHEQPCSIHFGNRLLRPAAGL
jgi:hypothetical protein